MAKLFKSLVAVAGAGLALGVTASGPKRSKAELQEDAILSLEPLLDRLDRQDREIEQLQAAMLELRQHADRADTNMQKLVDAIEKLCAARQL